MFNGTFSPQCLPDDILSRHFHGIRGCVFVLVTVVGVVIVTVVVTVILCVIVSFRMSVIVPCTLRLW